MKATGKIALLAAGVAAFFALRKKQSVSGIGSVEDVERVIFRKYPDGEVIALFPDIPDSPGYCLSYMHIGQHGGADFNGVMADTKPATPKDYYYLYLELVSLGYTNLVVVDRKNGDYKKNFHTNPRRWDYIKQIFIEPPFWRGQKNVTLIRLFKEIINICAVEINYYEGKNGGSGGTLYLNCQDIDEMKDYCREHGIKVEEYWDWDELD